MPQPVPYSQIESADLASTPVLSLLAERGLEFRRVPFRIRQVFTLFLRLFALASAMSILLIMALEKSPAPTASISIYGICGAVALIASVWILLSNRNLRVIVTNDGISVRSTSARWDQIVGVRRRWLFHSSVFVDKAAPIEISNWLQGGGFVLDLCGWAKDHKLEFADDAAIVTAIDKMFRAKGCWFEYVKLSWVPLVGRMIALTAGLAWCTCLLLLSGNLVPTFFGFWFAVYFSLLGTSYVYVLATILRARRDRIGIDRQGVRQFRSNVELTAIAWADVTGSTEQGPRLRFPIRHRLTKTSMTGIGMSHITLNTLMDAVLEFGHAA